MCTFDVLTELQCYCYGLNCQCKQEDGEWALLSCPPSKESVTRLCFIRGILEIMAEFYPENEFVFKAKFLENEEQLFPFELSKGLLNIK